MKVNKQIVLSSILCILPLLVSVLLYNQLPGQMPIHWNKAGEANGYIPKNIGVWMIPAFLLIIHLIVTISAEIGLRKKQISNVTNFLCFWSIPIASLLLVPASLMKAAGYKFDISRMVLSFVGILFVIAGNYLPKNRQNNVAGYKLPWSLNNADNWNKTHMLAGIIWVIAGFVLIISALTDWNPGISIIPIFIIALLTPIVYSYFIRSPK